MDYNGAYKVSYGDDSYYYSEFGAEDPGYIMNKYLNPYFGYHFYLVQPDPTR